MGNSRHIIPPEVRVGLLVVGAVVLGVAGYRILKGRKVFGGEKMIYIVFAEASGVTTATPLMVKGVEVGRVVDKQLLWEEGSGEPQVLVKAVVEPYVKLPRGTVPMLVSADLLGTRAIQLMLGRDTAHFVGEGDTLYGVVALTVTELVREEIKPVKLKAEELMSSLDTLVKVVKAFLSGEAKAKVEGSFSAVERSLHSMESAARQVDSLVAAGAPRIKASLRNIESITSALAARSSELATLVENLSALSDTLRDASIGEIADELRQLLTHLTEVAEALRLGEGTAGRLLHDTTLYVSLEKAVRSLDSLLVDMRTHPYRYLHVSLIGPGPRKVEKWAEKHQEREQKKNKENAP